MCFLEFYYFYIMVGGDEMKVKEETTMGSILGEVEEEEVKLLIIEEIRDIKKGVEEKEDILDFLVFLLKKCIDIILLEFIEVI